MKGRKLVNARRRLPAACTLYGIHAVEEWLDSRPARLLQLYVSRAPAGRLSCIVDLAVRKGIAVEHVDDRFLASVAGTDRHQGIVALASEFPYVPLESLLAARLPTVLILDRIQDPRNLGAILRTAAAIGGAGVLLPRDGSVPITASVEVAAAGGAARVSVSRVTNLVRTVRHLQEAGYWVIALDAREGVCFFELELPPMMAMVVGGEVGVRPLLRGSCDQVARLPMPGGMESLNVSVAVAVVLYEMYRRRVAKN